MPNLRQTSSWVVSRCRLSNTALSLNSAEYCLRLPSIVSSTFLDSWFPYSTVYSIRYWTAGEMMRESRANYALMLRWLGQQRGMER